MLVSFDVGCINLSFCVLDEKAQIVHKDDLPQWKVVNLLKNPDEVELTPCIGVKKGKQKGVICGKISTIRLDDGSCYCSVHNPDKTLYKPRKKEKLADFSFLDITKNLITFLDSYPILLEAERVIIESQPSKNSKMKNLSHIIYSYFLLRSIDAATIGNKKIEFVSARNKLKVYTGPEVKCTIKDAHARNKFLGNAYCRYILKDQQNLLDYFNSHKKTDDLADSYMQGLWYLNRNGELDEPAKKCAVIVKGGKRKGLACGKKIYKKNDEGEYEDVCTVHSPNKKVNTGLKCETILKNKKVCNKKIYVKDCKTCKKHTVIPDVPVAI